MTDLKVLIVGVNSKFSHTNLAIRYLKKTIEPLDIQVNIYEPNINNSEEQIIRKIYKVSPDLLAFSCYIWNIEQVLKVSKSIKELLPNIKVLLGGPEVSFENRDFFTKHDYIDYIIRGEGEIPFKELVIQLARGKDSLQVKGLLTSLLDNGIAQGAELNNIPFPYEGEDLDKLSNQIIYYEASRGCPFSCSYCLSSTTRGVRTLKLERVKSELLTLSKYVKMIKFVDRTFNCNPKTTVELLEFIKGLDTDATFHLEISAHLINDEILSIFSTMPKNRVQLEIGVQTTNPKSVEAIQRSTDFDAITKVVKKINSFENIHQHLDLIAGLPHENYQSFKNSFNDVMKLKPHKLQLGFLKLLKGSKIREEKELHQYKFNDFPPYEILENKYMSFQELSDLKYIEHLLDTYYNSHRFDNSIKHLHYQFKDYFKVYEQLYYFFKAGNRQEINHSLNDYFMILLEFYKAVVGTETDIFLDLLKVDYLSHKRTHNIPCFLGESSKVKERVFEFLKDESNIAAHLPNFMGSKPTEIYKQIIVEKFSHNPLNGKKNETYLLFNYQEPVGIFEKPQIKEILI